LVNHGECACSCLLYSRRAGVTLDIVSVSVYNGTCTEIVTNSVELIKLWLSYNKIECQCLSILLLYLQFCYCSYTLNFLSLVPFCLNVTRVIILKCNHSLNQAPLISAYVFQLFI
jgi:hypothetical protein